MERDHESTDLAGAARLAEGEEGLVQPWSLPFMRTTAREYGVSTDPAANAQAAAAYLRDRYGGQPLTVASLLSKVAQADVEMSKVANTYAGWLMAREMGRTQSAMGSPEWLARFCGLALARLVGPSWPGWITRETWPG